MTNPLSNVDLDRVLDAAHDHELVLIGGQAVAFWANYYDVAPVPVTGDVDFYQRSPRSARALAEALDLPLSEAKLSLDSTCLATPSAALIELPRQDAEDGETARVDFLWSVRGVLSPRSIELERPDGKVLKVLHPIDCIHSKISNLALPSYRATGVLPQARAQADVAIRAGRCFLEATLEDDPSPDGCRVIRSYVKELFDLARCPDGHQAYLRDSLDAFDAARNWSAMDADYRTRAYDHWVAELSRRRAARAAR